VDAETLEHRAAGFFLRMQTELHVSRQALQKIVEGFNFTFFKIPLNKVSKQCLQNMALN